MIIVKICGGLGNQMFQYACAFALSERLKTGLALDVDDFKGDNLRKFALGEWQISENQKLISTHWDSRWNSVFLAPNCFFSNQIPWPKCLFNFILHLFLRLRYWNWKIIVEKQSGHYQNMFQLRDKKKRILLSGYWQSEQYFIDIEKCILDIFTPSQNLSHEDLTLASTMSKNPASVSVHIRCGDYLDNFHTWKTHYVCTPAYYKNAFHLMKEKLFPKNPHFHIFSDDPEWVKTNIEIPYPHTVVSNGKRIESHEISLMSKCHHHIIANSSFSWWGAWLNRDKKKIVITPPRWFNNSNPTPDLIPKSWMKCSGNEDRDRDYILFR